MKKTVLIILLSIIALGIKSYYIGKDAANREHRFLISQGN